MSLIPGPNIIKLFTSVIYEYLQEAIVFVFDRPFQPSLMFVSTTGANLSEASFSGSTL